MINQLSWNLKKYAQFVVYVLNIYPGIRKTSNSIIDLNVIKKTKAV